jgi:phage tail-like protein
MWAWRQLVIDGQVDSARKDGSISMFDHKGTLVAQWTFDRGWPVKVTGPSVKSDSNEVGVEELTIAHEGTRRVK